MPVPHLQPKEYVAKFGLDAPPSSAADALAYTAWLAKSHYENFHVVSFLLPKRLHQDFYNVYAFCRWADDLGDEIGDKQESLRLLARWREQLQGMYCGETCHPVFLALRPTVERYEIPIEPFDRLISAFEHDQQVTRYANFDEVFAYCENSANPVGHLVLYLGGYRDSERQRLSDYTCTGLQLANFWQDVSVDLEKDRVYLPSCLMTKHGYSTEELFAGVENKAFRALMAEAVDVAEQQFRAGLPLIKMVDRRLSLDLDLFSCGGRAILKKIRLEEYRVLKRRPAIRSAERLRILCGAVGRFLLY